MLGKKRAEMDFGASVDERSRSLVAQTCMNVKIKAATSDGTTISVSVRGSRR